MGARAVVAELAKKSEYGWKFIVDSCILSKSIDLEFLQGILVENSSFKNTSRVWVFAMPWFSLDGGYLRFAHRLSGGRFFEGDAAQISREVMEVIDGDQNLQKFLSEPITLQGVIEFNPVIIKHPENFPAGTVLDLAILHALNRQNRTALDMLFELLDRTDSYPLSEASATIARSVADCLSRGEALQPLLQPLIAANKSRWPIKPIKPGSPKRPKATKPKQSAQANKETRPGYCRTVENTYLFSITFPDPIIENEKEK